MPQQNIPVIDSPVEFPCPISPERIALTGLRLKKGAGVSLTYDDTGKNVPELVLSRGQAVFPINFKEIGIWSALPSVTISSSIIDAAFSGGGESVIGRILSTILSVVSSINLELLLEEGGQETNNMVRVSIKAGELVISTEVDLAEILEFVGENGTVPAAPAAKQLAAPVPPPTSPQEELPPYDHCSNCTEGPTGKDGEPCSSCEHMKT